MLESFARGKLAAIIALIIIVGMIALAEELGPSVFVVGIGLIILYLVTRRR